MLCFYRTRRRHWPLVAAVLLTVCIFALLSGPRTPLGGLSYLTWTSGELPAAHVPAAAPNERLEFYGAARNLFSSNWRSASASLAPKSPELSLLASPTPRTSSVSPIPALPSQGPQPDERTTPSVVVAPTKDTPSKGTLSKDTPSKETQPKDSSTEQAFRGYDFELEKPGVVEPLTNAFLRDREREYAERRSMLERACKAHKVGLAETTTERSVLPERSSDPEGPVEAVNVAHFTAVPTHKTLACLVNKAASTSLLDTFLKLTGHGVPTYSDFSSPHAIAEVLHPTKPGAFELAKKHYFKFLFVRHPLERLISAYEDKVVQAPHPSLVHLRKAIFIAHEDKYIRDETYALLRSGAVNSTAVLADYDARLAEYWAEVQARNNIPTFNEFLEFVIARNPAGEGFDSHWTPYWRQCAPCHMHYDVIGKLETGADDFKYVWHRMQIYDKVKIPWAHSLNRSRTLQDQVRTYLSPVKASVVSQLGDLFRLDFDLFGYDWEQTLRWSGHCPDSGTCSIA